MIERYDGDVALSPSPGTHLLGVSPPMVGFERLAWQYVARGLESGDGCVVVTTDQDARSVVASLADRAGTTDLDRLGVVDATSHGPDLTDVPCHVESVSSPADLTGIGIGLSKHLESLADGSGEGYRVLFDSVSSLLVYTGFERVFQFLHTAINQIDKIEGSSLSLLSADTDGAELRTLESVFDGIVEARETEDGLKLRARTDDKLGEWHSLGPDRRPGASGDGLSEAAGTREESPGRDPPRPALDSPGSLREVIEAMDTAGLTLTLCNDAGDEAVREELREYFSRLNVTVRTADLSTEQPADVALLHRGADVLATSAVPDLHTAVTLDALDSTEDLTTVVRPDVLDHVHRREYAVEDGTKLELVRISRLIETRALDTGAGTLHTGFQRLERMDDELDTRTLYESIAHTDATVHLYGEAGEVPNAEWYRLHTDDERELAEAWFVVFDGAGRDARKAALVCEETAPDRYTGFWTYQPSVVDAVLSYLEATYADA